MSQTPAQIEADIELTRARLAGTVDELSTRLAPKEVARRSVEGAKVKAHDAAYTPEGELRVERVGAVGGAAALLGVLVGLRVWRRKRHG